MGEQETDSITQQKELQSTLDELKKELAELTTANTQLESDLGNLNKEHTTLKTNADNVVQIVNQSDKFRAENERLLIEFESLQSENAMLLRTAVIKWVLTGAGILFIGWIMGKASRNMVGPVFFEFIQRKKDEGFGEGNFTALFESMERDQLRRGVISGEDSE